ncbi:MAG: adenosine deaminase [Gammaproteobacteria bacterium]|nr:adenosine deaminase [Gammaproteobacteria bacterium]
MNNARTFIEGLPKAELHLHIEGSFEPELMFELAQRNSVRLAYGSVAELREAYAFSELQDFLDIYYQGMSVLVEERDFYDLTHAYLRRMHAQNVRHVEIFFDPQGHTDRGVDFTTVIDGIWRALQDAWRNYGISSQLIMCFLRHLDQNSAMRTLDQALAYKDRIVGVGLDSSELGHPPSKFADVFARARREGFRLVAHAGEEGPPEYIYEALDVLHVQRIDHGNRALEDPALIERLAAENMPLTVCPLSNLRLCVVEDLRDHPLQKMLELRLCATVNSDDPAYFGGYINENFVAVQEALQLTRKQIIVLARNGFTAAFLDAPRRTQLLRELDDYVAAHP